MSFMKLFLVGAFACLAIYLFATAPAKLPESNIQTSAQATETASKLFNTVNAINEAARFIYTKKIVGEGKKVGLKFGEDWNEPGVEKGPLPALFLRLVAKHLEKRPEPLGLYLGSDEPINKSNLFSKDQLSQFQDVKQTLKPQYVLVDEGRSTAMYPDFASVDACVTCHNEHADSPKTDWALNDVMGATTWTYPARTVSQSQLVSVSQALYQSVADAYRDYLAKAATFAAPVSATANWPGNSVQTLPDVKTFMQAVLQQAGPSIAEEILVPNILE